MQRDTYENKLRASGFEKIGGGAYSNVFAKPNSDKVIKVARNDAWPEYILWATRNGHAGKFAPKVYSLKFHDDFYVAVMERLVCTIGQARYDEDLGQSARSKQVEIFNHFFSGEHEAVELAAYVTELKRNNLRNDLHDGNVMLRHDGQMVIIDPVSGDGSSRFRIKSGACL